MLIIYVIILALWSRTIRLPTLLTDERQEIRTRFRARNTGFSLHPTPHNPTQHTVDFLLTVPWLFLRSSSSLFVRLYFPMWRFCCFYLFLISPSFGASRELWCVIVIFTGNFSYIYMMTDPTSEDRPTGFQTKRRPPPPSFQLNKAQFLWSSSSCSCCGFIVFWRWSRCWSNS